MEWELRVPPKQGEIERRVDELQKRAEEFYLNKTNWKPCFFEVIEGAPSPDTLQKVEPHLGERFILSRSDIAEMEMFKTNFSQPYYYHIFAGEIDKMESPIATLPFLTLGACKETSESECFELINYPQKGNRTAYISQRLMEVTRNALRQKEAGSAIDI